MVHCGVNQHQQKGMKAQFLVAGGEGDVPNVPGISGLPPEDRHESHAQGEETAEDRPAPGPGALLALLGAAVALGLRGDA